VPSCPACGKDTSGEFAFCPFCGAPQAGAGPSPSREERKVVSVLFCDLVGFTSASELADPEDVRARLRPYQERARAELERFGATVEKFIGDAIMAVFGAPVVHEDDAERAVRASLQLIDAVADLNAADPTLSLQVRIGVNTGEAVVDLGARPELGQGIATGDVVNTASRLQGVAPINGVAVSEATYRQTERVFDYEALGTAQVKGKSEPLVVWQPLRPRARLGTDITRGHSTPLVGRDWEKSLLTGTFERTAQQRSTALVVLVGEPGMGKSRLGAELLHYIEDRPGLVRWRQGHCLPYGDKIAFWALGEIVKAECGILESDTADEAAAKLDRALPADAADRLWLKARLAPLAGLPGDAAAQDESFAAWRRFLESLAAQRETVLLFEDLHWADDAFLAFLEELCDRTRDVPLLVLCTARPELYEQHPTFGVNVRNAQRLDLGPLSKDETSQLITSLLGRSTLSEDTHETLLEQSGGNPLYAGEFVRLLDDQGRLRQHVAELPDSVQALIAARLDTLAQDRKSLLQDAAVIGKVFWAGALAELGGRALQDVTDALHELARKELVHEARTSSMQDEHEYAFSHLLVRDVCYAQIPRTARATRHRAAAAWLEGRAGERIEDLADVLAHHYLTALDLTLAAGHHSEAALRDDAIRCLSLAAERATALDAARAEVSVRRALDIAPDDHPQRARLLELWGQALVPLGRQLEARDAVEDALARYEATGDALGAGRALMALSIIRWILGEHAGDAGLRAVELLEAHPGPELVDAHIEVAGEVFVNGDYAQAIEAAQRALQVAEDLGVPEPARALGFLGGARGFRGDRSGIDDMRRALTLAMEQNPSRDAGVIYANLAVGISMFDGPRAVLDVCEEAMAFCAARGVPAMHLYMRAVALRARAQSGLVDGLLDEADVVLAEATATGDVPVKLMARSVNREVRAHRGAGAQVDIDVDELASEVRHAPTPYQSLASTSGSLQLLVALDRPAEARQLLTELAHVSVTAEPLYPASLADFVRCGLAIGDVELVRPLVVGVEARTPFVEHAVAAARALLAEADGYTAEAAVLFADSAARWAQFGNVPEHAFALLGQGRCLRALGDPGAADVLTEAERLFASLRYEPALAEARALLRG
jgi:class 3 adenylate cyclase/tetratricopeptide (TPR) repeat protein